MSSNQTRNGPNVEVYDLGVIELGTGETVEKDFVMPFDGWVQRLSPSWPPGSNNSIGFNLKVEEPDLPDEEIPNNVQEYVDETRYWFPANHPNPEYVTDDNVFIPFYPFQFIPGGTKVVAEITNGSTTNPLDLQLRASVTDFDPRQLSTSTAGRGGDF